MSLLFLKLLINSITAFLQLLFTQAQPVIVDLGLNDLHFYRSPINMSKGQGSVYLMWTS